MKTHNLVQGTSEWLAYRAQHFNASDAPAMMGASPYKTRSQLLHELHTGLTAEVDPATQRRFNDGHRFEELARPLAETIIGEDLYPVVGSDGELSASFDGLTMDESTNFEHKSLNEELRAVMVEGCTGADLPLAYRVQMEQQHLVSGASRTLFMASKWDRYETLIEERHCWYSTDMALRQQIIDGWKQFAQDLAEYVPPSVVVKAVAAPQMGLPAVSITVNGSIALVDNLEKFGAALTSYVERINKKPETDQDFSDLEATVKTLKTAEEALDAAEANALAQTESIDVMRRTVALYRDTARTNRLLVEKLVKAEKENRRIAIVNDAVFELENHVRKLNDRLGYGYMPNSTADFQGVIKGLKSIDSMRDKVAGELARCKIEANSMADRIQLNLETDGLELYSFLFADLSILCIKNSDDFANTVAARIGAHKAKEAAKEEATRARIQAEEQAKAERDAREKLAAEQEAEAKLQEEIQAHADLEAFEIKRLADLNSAVIVEATKEAPKVVQMPTRPAPAPATPPSLALGEISARLGFNVTSAFLATLGFEAVTVRAAKLYYDRDFSLICARLVSHIQNIQATQAA